MISHHRDAVYQLHFTIEQDDNSQSSILLLCFVDVAAIGECISG